MEREGGRTSNVYPLSLSRMEITSKVLNVTPLEHVRDIERVGVKGVYVLLPFIERLS